MIGIYAGSHLIQGLVLCDIEINDLRFQLVPVVSHCIEFRAIYMSACAKAGSS